MSLISKISFFKLEAPPTPGNEEPPPFIEYGDGSILVNPSINTEEYPVMLDPPPFDESEESPKSNIEGYPVMLVEESPLLLDEELSSNHGEPPPTKLG